MTFGVLGQGGGDKPFLGWVGAKAEAESVAVRLPVLSRVDADWGCYCIQSVEGIMGVLPVALAWMAHGGGGGYGPVGVHSNGVRGGGGGGGGGCVRLRWVLSHLGVLPYPPLKSPPPCNPPPPLGGTVTWPKQHRKY